MPRNPELRAAWIAAYRETKRERMRLYDATPERRAKRDAYRLTPAGREANKRYRQSPGGRAGVALSAERVRRGVVTDRQEVVSAIKLEMGCVDCGYAEDAIALDFDHVRGEKIANVSKMAKALVAWDLVLDEIAKCEVVCANCHRIRTRERKDYTNRSATKVAGVIYEDALFALEDVTAL